ncbi:SURF1 family protein [Xanthobacter autotrophicus]|uniref:SURF1 family protein n=1 Tax=Xanthobacter TaxID=279 RepID=UPI0024AAAD7D|nr:SURF1 family protein [Xanthobacter autotrophicus]MDI4663614.1 SURF1 family protein [Xanthobacter autotrophicus]
MSHPTDDAARREALPARGLLLPALAALAAFLILVGLGTWQLERRAWKEDLLARVEARVHAAPEPVPPSAAWPHLTREADEYRRVRARGTFDHARETLVYTVRGEDAAGPLKGQGFLVVTPLLRPDGPPLLVNRGFVPLGLRDAATRVAGQVSGEVEVVGLLRFPEEASWFVPANDPARDSFYRMDPVGIAAARGLAAAPFIIDQEAGAVPGHLPAGGGTRLAFPNRHLEYALTWYGLAAALVAVAAAFLWTRRGRRPG